MKIANLPIGALLASIAMFVLGQANLPAILAGNVSLKAGAYLVVGGVLMIFAFVFTDAAIGNTTIRGYLKTVGYEPPAVFGILMSVVVIFVKSAAALPPGVTAGLLYVVAGIVLVFAVYAKGQGFIALRRKPPAVRRRK